MNRRQLLQSAGLIGLSTLLPSMAFAAEVDTSDLKKMTGDIVPIGREERAGRIARAQELMRKNGLSAVVIEPGSSLIYFTGVRWWRSERLTAAVIPVSGEPLIVTPFFERPSVQETLGIPAEIRVWQEDESPTAVIAKWLAERKLDKGQIGIEETVRFFASDGLGKLLPGVRLVSANPVVRGCRMHKTPAEIALMQKANDVTIAAIHWTAPRIQEGMTRDQVAEMIVAATQALGGNADGALVLLGEAAAYPHGSGKPQFVREGEVVLIDCGCTVDGYASDISRTLVFGKVPVDVRRVFETVAEGQKVAMRTAQLGTPAGKVDDAVRAFYEREGYGPGYKLPGLSHRTGHGIGMDGHEPVNLVHGETTPLEVGMCFSNEPGLYFPGKFGVRLEDCFHMTPAGPKFFSEPPSSIDQPV
ncbi:Xaa-Pro peptidase family protein [Sphingomonas sp.]|uniref:M24 family metallopeptidase n=1 Tax=Sphingomonas sp. TaxID=28214 RepID=UPI002DB821D4|nr:Xaa-Pro peptidase family protein [Sphingomonas sp.]HEU4967360.1 Xaa-Pro peptidase family protein [Sphingomonas sp.]